MFQNVHKHNTNIGQSKEMINVNMYYVINSPRFTIYLYCT